jgi:hypothetical protein
VLFSDENTNGEYKYPNSTHLTKFHSLTSKHMRYTVTGCLKFGFSVQEQLVEWVEFCIK